MDFTMYTHEGQSFCQKDMENWYVEKTTDKAAYFLQQGVIGKLKPSFVSCDFAKGESLLSFPTQNWQKNPHEVIHGGVLSTCFHTALYMLCGYYARPQTLEMAQLSVSFLQPVFMRDIMFFHGKIKSFGESLVYAEAELLLESTGKVAATAAAMLQRGTAPQHK